MDDVCHQKNFTKFHFAVVCSQWLTHVELCILAAEGICLGHMWTSQTKLPSRGVDSFEINVKKD